MSYLDFFFLLSIVSGLSTLTSFIVGLFNASRMKGFLMPLLIYLAVSVIFEIYSYVNTKLGINNLYVFHIFTVVEFCLILFVYMSFLKDFNQKNRYVLALIPLFLLAEVADLKINGPNNMDNFASSIESIILIFIALMSFFIIIRKMIYDNILNTPFFWINTGILLYFSGNLLFFVFSNYLHANETSNNFAMWGIHSVMNILYNVSIVIGFWKIQKA